TMSGCYAPSTISSTVLVFLFQAEDAIRDFHVTGVQTCALPISLLAEGKGPRRTGEMTVDPATATAEIFERMTQQARKAYPNRNRSEERRVGKECRSRSGPHHKTDQVKCREDQRRRSGRSTKRIQ